jgi:hypothetical protein
MGDRTAKKLNTGVIEIIEFPRSVIKRCPAMRLAVKRTHRVRGRIRFLDSSIITINGMRGEGVPCGSMWDSIWLVFLVHPNMIIESQVTRDRGRVMVRWEVRENDCGYSAVTFIIRIRVKISSNVTFCLLFFFRLNEISFLMNRDILFLISVVGFEVFHVFRGVSVMIRINIVQERDSREEEGSKIENRFVIILFFFGLLVFWWGLRG